FVTRNVHAATGIDTDHQRNLCEFVLGRKAVEKVSRLALADSEARVALTEIKTINKQLELHIKKPDTLETFLGLANDPGIDQKLETVRAELKKAQSKDVILARMVPKEIRLPHVDRNAIDRLLEKSTEGIGETVAAVVNAHIKEHLDPDGERWLAYGANHIGADSKCPFCALETTKSDLVTAIRSFFSAEYKTFTESLSLDIQQIRDQLGSEVFAPIRAGVTGQLAASAQWADVIPIDQPALATALDEAEAAWKCGATKLGALIKSKQAKPLEGIEPSLADEAVTGYARALTILKDVNIILTTNARKIEEWKATLSKADTTEIEKRLHRLENQKARFEPLAQELISKRNALIEKRNKLDEEKVILKKEIDEYAVKVVGKYQAGINHYLNHFGCDIRIESVEPRFPSGRASVQYTLKAHGHEIELGVSDTGPCFETVLSDGDKYTLALSFFFARLKDHASLNGRIIVLDDPVNSFGSSRRTLLEEAIRDMRLRGAQVVVLTHDERLAAMMWRDKKLNGLASLQVERTRAGSCLKPWDVERATQSAYVGDYLTLIDYLDHGGDHEKPRVCIRPYLEQRLRHLFPGPPFQTRDTLGQMIGKIRSSTPGSRLSVLLPKLSELESINNAALPSYHATDDVPGMPPLTPDGVRLFAEKALAVLG
ncbi:MAG: AAA family ATPase, partial [Elusimicrobia bacterium]|nr:AAA family ATPase [Elusimicrobiota bacterium]